MIALEMELKLCLRTLQRGTAGLPQLQTPANTLKAKVSNG
jgi:hypothetical protein